MQAIKNFFKNNFRSSFKTRQVKYGGYAVLLTLALLAGLILLNLTVSQFSPQLDLTWSGLYTLSEQSLQVLETIQSPVRFYGLWRPGEENQDVITVINLYLARSPNISFELVDPDRNPGFVLRYDRERQGIPRGSLIVEGEMGFRLIGPRDFFELSQSPTGGASITGISVERRITSALLFAATGETPVVYEITGHDEIPLAAMGMENDLELENFALRPINLLLADIPYDATMLVLNCPRRDLAAAEAEKLLDYLDGGGRLMVLADFNIMGLTNLNTVLASYGLEFNYGIVRETDPFYVAIDPRSAWPDLLDHEITRPLLDKTRTPVVLFEPMALSILETRRRTVEVTPLMTSSPSAFLRSNLDETSTARTASDMGGPLVLAAAVSDPSWVQGDESQTRIVAIGAGSLLPLGLQAFGANLDLFMNGITWLGDRPENISIRSKSVFVLPLRMNLVQIALFGALFVFLIPTAFFAGGLVTWLKRRHL
ncbi:MAG: GldG family protein [Treponema sp.]|nr:GldG family protein [Treponema sp.]